MNIVATTFRLEPVEIKEPKEKFFEIKQDRVIEIAIIINDNKHIFHE